MPTTAQGNPTRVMSKKSSPSNPFSRSIPWTTRLVLVPISVHMPPRIAAKDNGMSNCEEDTRMRFDQSLITGMSIATMGVLLRNALKAVTGSMRRIWARSGESGWPRRRCTTVVSAPVWPSPAATTNNAAIVTIPSLEKPASPADGVTAPAMTRMHTPPRMMRYGATRVAARETKTPTTTESASHAWGLTRAPCRS